MDTFGKHLKDIEKQPKEQKAAALWLLNHFVRLHAKHLRSTLRKWGDWEASDVGSNLRNTLEEPPMIYLPDPVQAELPPTPTINEDLS